MIGFGIDLAGYTTGRSAVAAIEAKGDRVAEAVLLRNSHLTLKHSSNALAQNVIHGDTECLRRCLALGPVAVDIPIDLQDLPSRSKTVKLWALTLRPIDKKLGAMPPFADRIGAPVARFAAMMRLGNFDPALGISLFETYPAATWKKLRIDAGKYKTKDGHTARIALCNSLKVAPHIGNHDDIDAIICAVTAVAPTEIMCTKADLGLDLEELPRGYRILKALPFDRVRVTNANADFDEWMTSRELQKWRPSPK
jgi:hypothetical protein